MTSIYVATITQEEGADAEAEWKEMEKFYIEYDEDEEDDEEPEPTMDKEDIKLGDML